ncbi:MAG: hypothetical protein B6242_03645 [Anaerolineaceae bacterium 4572_78]|nr:MAG: hypothetical protein B6242_03645 [Anaerolineaceae bacterium 4572_78]
MHVIRYEVKTTHAFLKIEINYHAYLIRISEILRTDGSRKYAYGIFLGNHAIPRFDNARDPYAQKLKYGNSYTQYRLDEIPHAHAEGGKPITLTDEMQCIDFIQWIESYL